MANLTNNVPEKDVQQVFDSIAGNYDKLNSIMSLGTHNKWRIAATDMIQGNPKDILDLCCGTADWSILLANKFQRAHVIGLDFSKEMLKLGQEKVDKTELDNIQLKQGDAMNLDYPDNTFDVITIGFGLRNVPDANQVLREIFRILKPGGQLLCLEAFKVETPVVKWGWKLYFNQIMPVMGKVFASHKNEYQYLDDSVNKFVSIKKLLRMYRDAGFINIRIKNLMMKSAAIHYGMKPKK
ncbi:demethylmenaquinone methyltransferase [Companilactobacillus mishanensis]|uniref:Demethylmenaquinone methyltransferase n=1 Tax=Companilactobacillus mishanensis TaxID=2486008 RepID=A0A5P0ZL41_9LACO|nr:demethylmenaquinone methyltransferase [Companilactobacillus mishanensis]MQS45547.1 demethylmenaquinone methyltransferase [Companilactobacillus mishanensis]MQS53387.1 demethylmenaquinone methyltransferase [Companilactobacillus mishanensis]MQS89852.1 demethylmenaquinone methyltransferase [Companilactobacillus mishanensis]